MSKLKYLNKVIDNFAEIESVKAIVLGGSSQSGMNDEYSDWDIYIFSDSDISIDIRREIAEKYSDKMEIDNNFWGAGDEWYHRESGKKYDLMYWTRQWMENEIDCVVNKHIAKKGYTTCFWYTVKNAQIVYDPEGWFAKLQQLSHSSYPEQLVDNIIAENYPLLRGLFASFRQQIESAIRRNDPVSINHRSSMFIQCYFDILFAVNKVLHPGEKRLLIYAEQLCTDLPEEFGNNMREYLNALSKPDVTILQKYDALCDTLDLLLMQLGYLQKL